MNYTDLKLQVKKEFTENDVPEHLWDYLLSTIDLAHQLGREEATSEALETIRRIHDRS